MRGQKKYKEGAASFYIVAFATLILMIVATSFAAVIISEVTRTSNDDLSQSAYDSAMAGIEDAKLAFYNYQNCKAKGFGATADNKDGTLSCGEIIWYVEQKNDDCDMVGKILGRGLTKDAADNIKGVAVQESSDNNMQQYYTCVTLNPTPPDYTATLSSSNVMEVIKAKFDGVAADMIKQVKISWYTKENGTSFNYANFNENGRGMFQKEIATPPTISVAMLQTAETFNLSDFDMTVGNTTDRGMVYLVPTSKKLTGTKANYYIGAWNSGEKKNHIGVNGFLKSNDKTKTNLPYVVYCENGDSMYACSATIDLPEPVGGERNDDTFVFVVSLPYGKPVTDFAMEFYCASGEKCATMGEVKKSEEVEKEVAQNLAFLRGVEIEIDSTGRANDLFRRVVTRLKNADDYALSIMGPLELLGNEGMNKTYGGTGSGDKDNVVTSEYNFITNE